MPCLTSCVIHPATTSTLPISALIQSLKNIPTIEVVEVSRLATSSSDPPPVPIALPNLSKISLSSSAIDVSNLFDSLDYPSSATVAYACDDYTDTIGNLQLTGLTAVCMRLSNPGLPGVAPSISQLSLTLTPWSISLAAFTDYSPFSPHICLSIESDEDSDLTPILTRLCYSLCLPLIPGLSLKGHSYSSIWNHIDVFQQFDPEVLNLVECDGEIFRSFKGHYQREPLFPRLRTLILQELTIDEDVLDGLVSMLVERIHQGKPIRNIIIECCTMLVEDIETSLEELVELEWDGNRWDSDSDGSFDDESVQTDSDDSDDFDDFDDSDNSDDDNE
ncbi:hypothetical protein ONZ45_g13837 [Pleurotus djamor]|nr:hypothetical protein ONZ45_g13837 [Pleurotus djamor]